ncbi:MULTISPECIES: DNA polymerase III subunit delta [Methylobacterium]|uniref:DNA-directed DNA polymerase n=1 Tax=Methylobacterium jeotgali TaxID=381630 RepID=A0ABQ4SXM9_9HYPH|nr:MULTISPECIES: DNA polymerase III subunit delta [Methylobacterium]PIU06313.1 MAG: DNA polymerase III subunit delta [Methylobacterium sp. CG09_land_8_20_14_0_10_71_15]PIU14110.1 MAG: DNA polymerase III subunit delta [Methylobacterium sp. CG08_land_8_20_14_0_20_71_15]GBU17467.1 DNA polymerase III subunit delta [Methylobacterium sp.]GJE06695.1 hypothetical protein AOPFMNJM_2017 [Methylobacterium jeotgali]
MTAVRAGDADALIRRGPDPRCFLILVYGTDTGLVAERAKQLAESFVADPGDPFAFILLDGDTLAADPGRLADEAGTVGLFGGRRAIRVRAGSKPFVAAVEAALGATVAETRIVVEAGDLARNNPMRTLCEGSASALAIPCYPDDARALADLIDRTLREQGLGIDREAREALAANLGSDRRASLSEIGKLALYAAGKDRVTIEDVEAVVGDASAGLLNAVIDATFAGQPAEVDRGCRRFRHEGLDPGVIVGSALRHALTLLATRLEGEGKSPSALAAGWRGLHFSRKASVEAQLARWSPASLQRAVTLLHETVLACRRASPDLAAAHASAVLLRIAEGARRS